ncbi:MAG: vanadium-dependent haloperoxidase [Bacteroidota bacterium]
MLIFAILFFACASVDYERDNIQAINYHNSVKQLTDVIVHDIFSPPVASRIYAYPNIAAYEVLMNNNPGFESLQGQLTGFDGVPRPDTTKQIDFNLAGIHAFNVVGRALIFSENKIDSFKEELYKKIKSDSGIPTSVFDNSLAYGNEVANHVLAWANKDNYKQTRTFPKYTIQDDPDLWKPTPPDYMEGIEPHWNKIRPFVIDSATQFVPDPPTPFDLDKESQFYKETLEVYETAVNLSDEQEEIAKFWDCNPYVSTHRGHAMFATKKITPGGHWMGITTVVTRQDSLPFMETVEAYTRVSIALADAFISCWDEKWRSIVIRPETVINQHIDEQWTPLLQTPPFPEYTSGHSVISSAAAIVLTDLLGESYFFVDTVELEYGLPARSFNSFLDASSEAAISRLYGGIHYMPAIENGVTQGKAVGRYVVNNLVTRKEEIISVQGE